MSTVNAKKDYIIVHDCGCITAWMMGGEHRTAKDVRDFYRDAATRNAEVRRVELTDELRQDPNFLPRECPHTPTGWRREEPKEPNPVKYRRVGHRKVSRVELRGIKGWEWFGGGEVGKRNGKWYATPGWMNCETATARDGKDPEGPEIVLGPFDKQLEAALALKPFAVERAAQWKMDEG